MNANLDTLKETSVKLVTLMGKKDPAWVFFKSLENDGIKILPDKIICELCHENGRSTY